MYLKSLELFGFKSFPSKTVLKFGPGITVVVGPNGCGKSNVFDAIKWALGEQSPKSLRGTKMEDVIFNGTATTPPLNYAEVTLIFSNEDNYLPIEYKEVAVTRRLYRSGESQYFINRNLCRLKDIQDLFMGTGIGEYTYSFIEQGRVEMLLSYKPEEKRLIFDEASGIIKYKDKKKETLRKLKDTEENILRLDDIILEVKRQMNYLERQVEKARKYNEIRQQLIDIEKKIATIKTKELNDKIGTLSNEIEQLKKKEKDKEDDISKKSVEEESIAKEINQMRKSVNEISSKVVSYESRIEGYFNHIAINRQRIEEIKERLTNLSNSERESKERIVLHKKRIEEEKNSLNSLDSQSQKLRSELDNLRRLKEDRAIKIKNAKKDIAYKKELVLQLEEKKTALNNSLIELETHTKSIFARKKRLTLDEARINNYLEDHRQQLASLEETLKTLENEFTSLKENKTRLRNQLKEMNEQIRQREQKLLEIEKTLVELKSYFEFLKDLKIKYDDFPLKKKVTLVFNEEPKDINKLIASLKGVEFRRMEFEGNYRYEAEVEAKIISLPEEELARRIDFLTREAEGLRNIIEESKNVAQKIVSQIEEGESIIAEKDNNLREYLQKRDNLNEGISRLEEEKNLIEDELKEVTKEISNAEEKQKSVKEELSLVESNLNSTISGLELSQNNTVVFSEEVNKFEIEIAKKDTEIKALQEQKESILTKLSLLEEESARIEERMISLDDEKRALNEREIDLANQILELETKVKETKERIEILTKGREKEEERLKELEDKLSLLQQSLKQEEGILEEIRNKIYNKRLEVQEINFEKAKIVDYLKQVYNVEFVAEEISYDISLSNLEAERDKLKKRMDSMGEVNLVAIEEAKELNERYQFLTTQKEDLLSSKESLKKAIQKINRTSKEVFLETFNRIEEEFKKYFRFLFGGGRAQLVLLDKENILESGVEIEVQPPGKKLQGVSLLSGGEKALTAIALIFSIFKVKPSPLCVLDEIDAPLDEANVDRFNQLLVEFSPTSQFIVITHNKKTMSRADVLYGVTMEERGISKLVSVRFAQEETSPVK